MWLLVAFWLWLLASSAFPVPLRQVAFWLLRLFAGLCGFGGFGFSHPLLSQFLSGLFGFLHPFINFWLWLPASSPSPVPPYLNHQTSCKGFPPPNPPDCLQRFPLFALSLLQISLGGVAPSPRPPPLLFGFLAEIYLHPYLNHRFFKHPILRENAVKYDILCNLCSLCMSVCMHCFEHRRRSYPRQASRCFLYSIAPFHCTPILNHHFFEQHEGAAPLPPRNPPAPLFESSLLRT